ANAPVRQHGEPLRVVPQCLPVLALRLTAAGVAYREMSLEQFPPTPESHEIVVTDRPPEVDGLRLELVTVCDIPGLCPGLVAQVKILDEVGSNEPSIGNLRRFDDCLVQVAQANPQIIGPEDPPGPVQGRRVGSYVLVMADVQRQPDQRSGP